MDDDSDGHSMVAPAQTGAPSVALVVPATGFMFTLLQRSSGTPAQNVTLAATASTRFLSPRFNMPSGTNPWFGAPAMTASTLLSHSEGYVFHMLTV